MKVLVTGAAGFIGYHLSKRLLERGDNIVGLDNINNYYDVRLKYARLKELGIVENDIINNQSVLSNRFSNFEFVKLDLTDRENLQTLFKKEKFDKVCNLAAQAGVRYSIENPYAYIESNVVGFLNILECCRHNNIVHLVYASSSSVYGGNAKVPFSEKDRVDNPVSLYAATKKSDELMAYTYSHLYKIPSTGLRYFTVYGPWGRPDMSPMLFAKAIFKDEPINVFNNGDMIRDFTYVDDIVQGTILVLDNPPISSTPYEIYNIGCSTPIHLMDFIHTLEKEIGKKAKFNFMPMQEGDVYQTYSSTLKLDRDFHYMPKITLQDGISRFIHWYMDYFKLR